MVPDEEGTALGRSSWSLAPNEEGNVPVTASWPVAPDEEGAGTASVRSSGSIQIRLQLFCSTKRSNSFVVNESFL